jgi:hypothetical protein
MKETFYKDSFLNFYLVLFSDWLYNKLEMDKGYKSDDHHKGILLKMYNTCIHVTLLAAQKQIIILSFILHTDNSWHHLECYRGTLLLGVNTKGREEETAEMLCFVTYNSKQY